MLIYTLTLIFITFTLLTLVTLSLRSLNRISKKSLFYKYFLGSILLILVFLSFLLSFNLLGEIVRELKLKVLPIVSLIPTLITILLAGVFKLKEIRVIIKNYKKKVIVKPDMSEEELKRAEKTGVLALLSSKKKIDLSFDILGLRQKDFKWYHVTIIVVGIVLLVLVVREVPKSIKKRSYAPVDPKSWLILDSFCETHKCEQTLKDIKKFKSDTKKESIGEIPQNVIDSEIKRNIKKISKCYEKHGQGKRGKIVVLFTISEGKVNLTDISHNDLKLPHFKPCILKVIRKLDFKKYKDKKLTIAKYPLVFKGDK